MPIYNSIKLKTLPHVRKPRQNFQVTIKDWNYLNVLQSPFEAFGTKIYSSVSVVTDRVIMFISLAPGRFACNFREIIFKLIWVVDGWGISCETALTWLSLDLIDNKSNIGSGNGLVPSGNKPLTEPMLKFYITIWRNSATMCHQVMRMRGQTDQHVAMGYTQNMKKKKINYIHIQSHVKICYVSSNQWFYNYIFNDKSGIEKPNSTTPVTFHWNCLGKENSPVLSCQMWLLNV